MSKSPAHGNGGQFYLVHVKADAVCCSCPDYQQRQSTTGKDCKHGHAVLLNRCLDVSSMS